MSTNCKSYGKVSTKIALENLQNDSNMNKLLVSVWCYLNAASRNISFGEPSRTARFFVWNIFQFIWRILQKQMVMWTNYSFYPCNFWTKNIQVCGNFVHLKTPRAQHVSVFKNTTERLTLVVTKKTTSPQSLSVWCLYFWVEATGFSVSRFALHLVVPKYSNRSGSHEILHISSSQTFMIMSPHVFLWKKPRLLNSAPFAHSKKHCFWESWLEKMHCTMTMVVIWTWEPTVPLVFFGVKRLVMWTDCRVIVAIQQTCNLKQL